MSERRPACAISIELRMLEQLSEAFLEIAPKCKDKEMGTWLKELGESLEAFVELRCRQGDTNG